METATVCVCDLMPKGDSLDNLYEAPVSPLAVESLNMDAIRKLVWTTLAF